VYDVTDYIDEHPGGGELLRAAAGTDATEVFKAVGHTKNARDILASYAMQGLNMAVCSDVQRCAFPSAWWAGLQLFKGCLNAPGRQRVCRLLATLLSALLQDLTEGRPDCKRVSPAVCHLLSSGARLQEYALGGHMELRS